MGELCIKLIDLEREVKNGKSFILCEPIYDSKLGLLIGTEKILVSGDFAKIGQRAGLSPYYEVKVRTAIPHYIEQEKRVQWANYAISYFQQKDLYKNLSDDKKDFIVKYLKSIISENDYLVWKLSQMKSFHKKVFEHVLNTCFIILICYHSYSLMNQSGMVDGKMVEKLVIASLLHSAGVTKFDPKIFDQKRIELSESHEYEEFLKHPIETYKLIQMESSKHEVGEDILQAILCQEEFLDGSGTPRGVLENDMDLLSRFLSISRFFEEIVAGEWSYKARSHHENIGKLRQQRAKFDPLLLKAMDASFKYLFQQ
jgi:HD-GYP domain-containing protein (c-di-GMP phosphodiesterase class II)